MDAVHYAQAFFFLFFPPSLKLLSRLTDLLHTSWPDAGSIKQSDQHQKPQPLFELLCLSHLFSRFFCFST